MDGDVSVYVQRTRGLARRARHVFLAAVLLCGLLAVNVTFLASRSPGHLEGVRFCFGPLLLWALTAAAYAFHSMAQAHAGMTQRVGDILSADKARALRELTTIKARLNWPGPGHGG